MPDVLVDASGDQPLPLLHIGIRGEVCAKVGVRTPEEEEGGSEDAGPDLATARQALVQTVQQSQTAAP